MPYRFETLDVFTDRRFGGNPLAVFTDAAGIGEAEMQALGNEFNLSEITFVFAPEDPANTAKVRIFTPAHEMPFAGHPSIGTAWVLARHGKAKGGEIRLEVPAGVVRVVMAHGADGEVTGGMLTAPQPLSTGRTVDVATIAACAGLAPEDVVTATHPPIAASVGASFVFAEVTPEALPRALPELSGFRAATRAYGPRFELFLYARDGDRIDARMFAPLVGVVEDPATGSANAALAALLLSILGGDEARFAVRQGETMGRLSLLDIEALRTPEGILGRVGGSCVAMMTGEFL
ncbi:PhzF family phenazine biosynthesis protein [Sphingomonas sp.]|uniref:PhzF family phenazine biosynthesis protein n=1 Tax=Sphingomonas sp. TaxID=28214 RepID=UPI001B073F7C|nr:PhzF family phenazine biosynthesis protein [Sphingomonas sp.]MBO9712408.1 PhzF family phenazine biosynthesis protein [Sphingomonas sp.]